MSTLYTWDPVDICWKIIPDPKAYVDNSWHKSSGFRFNKDIGRYMKLWGEGFRPSKVSFANATWDEIKFILNGYYVGLLDINNYWEVGESRMFNVAEIPAGTTNELQPAQQIEMQIVDIAKDDLATPTLFRNKAALSLISKDVLQAKGNISVAGLSSYTTPWTNTVRRTWCNNDFLNALDSDIASEVQQVKKITARNSDTTQYKSNDFVWIPSTTELVGTYPREGSQYKYYAENGASSRIAPSLLPTTNPTVIDGDNISTYFIYDKPEVYNFGYDYTNKRWYSGNKGVNNGRAAAKFTARQDITFTINLTVSSQANYDKAYLYVSNTGTNVVNGISGNNVSSNHTITLLKGEYIQISYIKNASTNSYDDRLYFKITTTDLDIDSYITRTINDTGIQSITGYTGEYNGYNYGGTSYNDFYMKIGFCL